MVHTRRRVSVVAAGASALLCMATVSGIAGATAAGAATSSGRTMLAGTLIPAAARHHPVGAVAKSARVNFELVLQLRNPAAASALVRAVSSPGSASYRHYLTAAQWESRFSPAASQVNSRPAVAAQRGVPGRCGVQGPRHVSASGTATQVERAFGTGLESYRLNGHTVRLATRQMSVPASVARSVVGAMGVNQAIATPADAAGTAASAARRRRRRPTRSRLRRRRSSRPGPVAPLTAPRSRRSARPSGTATPTKVPYVPCGYKPGQFRSAYNVGSADTGKGETVAIIDAYGSSTIAADATRYFKENDPGNPFAKAAFTQIDATPFDDANVCAPSSWLTEQAIDVEAVHSTAPNAHILYVGAQDCENGLFTAEQTVIDNGLANVVTNSWGDDAGDLLDDVATRTAYDDLFMLADSTGMTDPVLLRRQRRQLQPVRPVGRGLPAVEPLRHLGGRHVAPGRGERAADRPARLGHRPLVQVHVQRGGRALHPRAAEHLASGQL